MRRFLSGALALALSAALCLPARAAAGAEIIRAFVYDGTLYTYMSIDGTDQPITKAEVKIRNQTFSAGCRLETVRQAGAPVTWLLLVDNSDSMPAFREDVENFAESLAQSGGEDSRFILASFGDAFAVANEDVPAEELAEAVEGLPLDERVTRLHTAINQAVSYFESVPREGNELRCLVVLSDGVQYDPSGGMPYEELWERVEQSDVILHSIGLGDDVQSLESMGNLAAASGGVHQVLGEELSPKDAGTALTEASGKLFVTGFDLSGGMFSGGVETAAVTLASHKMSSMGILLSETVNEGLQLVGLGVGNGFPTHEVGQEGGEGAFKGPVHHRAALLPENVLLGDGGGDHRVFVAQDAPLHQLFEHRIGGGLLPAQLLLGQLHQLPGGQGLVFPDDAGETVLALRQP